MDVNGADRMHLNIYSCSFRNAPARHTVLHSVPKKENALDEQKTPVTLARRTYLAMMKILPELQEEEGEKGFRERVERFFMERWNCGDSTFRKWKSSRYPPQRSPSDVDNPGFFADAKMYGNAKFRKNGVLIESSLGKGPDIYDAIREMRAERAGESKAA